VTRFCHLCRSGWQPDRHRWHNLGHSQKLLISALSQQHFVEKTSLNSVDNFLEFPACPHKIFIIYYEIRIIASSMFNANLANSSQLHASFETSNSFITVSFCKPIRTWYRDDTLKDQLRAKKRFVYASATNDRRFDSNACIFGNRNAAFCPTVFSLRYRIFRRSEIGC